MATETKRRPICPLCHVDFKTWKALGEHYRSESTHAPKTWEQSQRYLAGKRARLNGKTDSSPIRKRGAWGISAKPTTTPAPAPIPAKTVNGGGEMNYCPGCGLNLKFIRQAMGLAERAKQL